LGAVEGCRLGRLKRDDDIGSAKAKRGDDVPMEDALDVFATR